MSRMAEQVTFVMVPPLVLIFLVLGTIFIGVATPTEGGAMGATGALILAVIKRRLDQSARFDLIIKQAMESTAKLSAFVLFILVGARVFSLTFYGVNGHVWVEHLLTSLPGGQVGFLIFVNVFVFLLAFFLDFFELAFIIIPLLGPAGGEARDRPDLVRRDAGREHADLVHAPALRLRAVLPALGRRQGALHRPGHRQAHGAGDDGPDLLGRSAFRVIQCIMVALVILFPRMVMHYKSSGTTIDPAAVQQSSTTSSRDPGLDAPGGGGPPGLPPLDLGQPPKIQ